jgi:hypothetical protein
MNTYDPADYICYRHMPKESERITGPVSLPTGCRLPAGYANKSWRTRIRSVGAVSG